MTTNPKIITLKMDLLKDEDASKAIVVLTFLLVKNSMVQLKT